MDPHRETWQAMLDHAENLLDRFVKSAARLG